MNKTLTVIKGYTGFYVSCRDPATAQRANHMAPTAYCRAEFILDEIIWEEMKNIMLKMQVRKEKEVECE